MEGSLVCKLDSDRGNAVQPEVLRENTENYTDVKEAPGLF